MKDLEQTLDELEEANSVRWYGRTLRKDKNNIMKKALDPRVIGTRKMSRQQKS